MVLHILDQWIVGRGFPIAPSRLKFGQKRQQLWASVRNWFYHSIFWKLLLKSSIVKILIRSAFFWGKGIWFCDFAGMFPKIDVSSNNLKSLLFYLSSFSHSSSFSYSKLFWHAFFPHFPAFELNTAVACTCNPPTFEAEYQKGMGSIPVRGNSPSIALGEEPD